MSFVETIRAADATGEVRAMYERQQRSWGYVPNYAKVFSLRPDVLAAWANLIATIRAPVDRRTFDFYHNVLGYSKVIVAEVNGFALGGGFELALMADISVVGSGTQIGMPATRFLGPALGTLHMFFYRLGPVLARRMLLTGDIIPASDLSHLSVFTEVVDDEDVPTRADWWALKVSRMPADGLVIAKEAFRLVEQMSAYQGEEVLSYLVHAYGTNLQFEEDEFNFVKVRAQHGTKRAFELRDEYFEVPEPE